MLYKVQNDIICDKRSPATRYMIYIVEENKRLFGNHYITTLIAAERIKLRYPKTPIYIFLYEDMPIHLICEL